MGGKVEEGCVFSTCTVESDSKKESVLMSWGSTRGLRRRLGDKVVRAGTGGFVGTGQERTWGLSERCNKMLLRPRTVLGLLFFGGERDCRRDGNSERVWSILGIQRMELIGPFYQDGGPNERGGSW